MVHRGLRNKEMKASTSFSTKFICLPTRGISCISHCSSQRDARILYTLLLHLAERFFPSAVVLLSTVNFKKVQHHTL